MTAQAFETGSPRTTTGSPRTTTGEPGAGECGVRRAHLVRRPAGERGAAAIWLVCLTPVLLVGAGLLIDGGSALQTRGRAADLAAQSARAAADAITQQSLRTGDPTDLNVDPSAARAAGLRLLTQAGATGTVTVTGPTTVTVTAHVPKRAAILPIIGIRDISGTATASATILHGVGAGTP